MLYISLIVSALLLFAVNWAAGRKEAQGVWIYSSCLGFLVAPFFVACVLPAVAFQSGLLCVAAILWRAKRGPSASFLPASCVATLVAYGMAGVMVFKSEREFAGLRSLYPFESLEARLPAVPASQVSPALPPATAQRLSWLENLLPDDTGGIRAQHLKLLHEDTVAMFINSPGFGVARMTRPRESILRMHADDPAPVQPGPRFATPWSPGDLDPLPEDNKATLGELLDRSIFEFVNTFGFGYFKDRRHVAGFQTHRFRNVPRLANQWRIQHLELMSLLVHDDPQVYVSSRLPRMQELHDEPTRPLDRFEKYALESLRQGEDLITTQTPEGVRMLGAIRSTRQCLPCHGGDRGALLGAFSYGLVPEKNEDSRERNLER